MTRYEYKSKLVTVSHDVWGHKADELEQACNTWAQEGWEVFSIICPQPSNWFTYRVTARRAIDTYTIQDEWELTK
jgi:hypothetical protein